MWSGPRNISTAMMRSWGSRADTHVTDEPFYANYLRETGVDHPGRDEVCSSDTASWQEVAGRLTGPVPDGKPIWFQKHMSHHLLPGMEGDWLEELTHAFLIRDPALVIASFSKVVEDPDLSDLGLVQQQSLFERVRDRTGRIPPVIDAEDVLRNPRAILERLCASLGVPFDQAMLHWEPGPRATDGIWAKHWYGSVEKSTGFEPWTPRTVDLDARGRALEKRCRPHYDALAVHRITI